MKNKLSVFIIFVIIVVTLSSCTNYNDNEEEKQETVDENINDENDKDENIRDEENNNEKVGNVNLSLNMSLSDGKGNMVDLSTYTGKLVFLNFLQRGVVIVWKKCHYFKKCIMNIRMILK